MDYDWWLMLMEEDNALWYALPQEVQTKGEAYLAEMTSPEGKKKKEIEDDEDFCLADKDKNGRLNLNEYKALYKKIYDDDVARFGDYVWYTEQQFQDRHAFFKALAKNKDGQSRDTMRKHKNLVTNYCFPIMMLRMQTKNPDGGNLACERTWTQDDLDDVMAVMKRDFELMKKLPDDVQKKMHSFFEEMMKNHRIMLDYEIQDLTAFSECDKDGDGRLSYPEYMEY